MGIWDWDSVIMKNGEMGMGMGMRNAIFNGLTALPRELWFLENG